MATARASQTQTNNQPAAASQTAVVQPKSVSTPVRSALLQNTTPALRLSSATTVASGGEPLAASVRARLERSFGMNLSPVRVHTGGQAARAARDLSARAFTFGNDIYLGAGESPADLRLMAHETAHVVQQQSAPALQQYTAGQGDSFEHEAQQASVAVTNGASFNVQERTNKQRVQRLSILGFDIDIPNPLNFFAEKANLLPGFRMLTLIIGINPINMSRVERSTSNFLRALVEIAPFGALLSQALENAGVFEKGGAFIDQQIRSLGMTVGAIKTALDQFIESLKSNPAELIPTRWGSLWERAKQIFTAPIEQLKSFATGLVTGLVSLIKDAILIPIARLAEGTRGYDLLKAVLGKDPITGEAVQANAEVLIGGFMKLISQEEVWGNLQKAKAIPRAWAWFQQSFKKLKGFVTQIPGLFANAFKSLELEDIILVPRAFNKIANVFGGFIGEFISWAGGAVWDLLEIIFDVVSPGALGYIKRTGAALMSILKNPLPFMGNLVKAAKLGFQNFKDNFDVHLKEGLINWIVGSLPGIYIPKAFSLSEIVKFVFSVLGISWQNIRQKLVKAVGETAVKAMETGFDIVVTLVTQGPAAAWDQIKDQLSNLKDTVIGGITDFVIDIVVKKAIPQLIAMFIPGAGFITAIIKIYDTIMVFVDQLSKIIQVVTSFINSIAAIAKGAIGAAAERVENTLAGLLSLAINFFAGFIGLGNVADKVKGVINKVRAPIDNALDRIVDWLRDRSRSFMEKLSGGSPQKRLDQAMIAAETAVNRYAGSRIGATILRPILKVIQVRYQLQSLEPVLEGGFWAVEGIINPKKRKRTLAKNEGEQATDRPSGIDPPSVASYDAPVIRLKFTVLRRSFELEHSLQRHHFSMITENTELKDANSLIHANVPVEDVVRDAHILGENLQGKLRRNVNAPIPVEGTYKLNARVYKVDRENHFFVISGDKVWDGVTKEELEIAKLLSLAIQRGITPSTVSTHDPRIGTLVNLMRTLNVDDKLIIVSDDPNLVQALRKKADKM